MIRVSESPEGTKCRVEWEILREIIPRSPTPPRFPQTEAIIFILIVARGGHWLRSYYEVADPTPRI